MTLPESTFKPEVIEQARDILGKWQTQAKDVKWVSTLSLLTGTVGNPDFLEWLDFLLYAGISGYDDVDACVAVQRIAEAIVTADKDMS